MDVNILLTSVGGLSVPSMIKSLRDYPYVNYRIIGVDMDKSAVGFHFTDKSYVVPSANSNNYINKILSLAIKEKINVIIPLSDEETIELSKYIDLFLSKGIRIACSEHHSIQIASDKGNLLTYLLERDVDIPAFRIPRNLEELKQGIYDLGYPDNPIVLKPRKSRGSRGFWIIKSDFSKIDFILKSRNRQELSLNWVLEAFDKLEVFPEIVLMEYLPGSDFNVDILISHGNPCYIIPNQRIVPDAGPLQNGSIIKDLIIERMVVEVLKHFNFDYWINIELAYSKLPNTRPLIYEINPRISAPIIANKVAGVDLLNFGIMYALDIDFPLDIKYKEIRMKRYWNEFFF